MATRQIYETGLDADVSTDTAATCPECSGRVRPNTIETVCEDCGLVVDDQRIDYGPEWRSFEKTERDRTGAPLTMARHDRGLSTEIGRRIDGYGNPISARKRGHLHRLRRQHRRGRWRTKSERNLAHGLGEIRRIVGGLDLTTPIQDRACRLFRRAQRENLLPGRSIEAMAAGSVYGAARCNGWPMMLVDVQRYARCGASGVRNAYYVLNAELGLPTEPMRPQEFVSRFASELNVPDRVRYRARRLAELAGRDDVVNGAQPSGFAAACLYEAAPTGHLTQVELADVADTTPVTIRTHSRTLSERYRGVA
ncbi:transcription initiation factor IIB family protein [Halopenitus salinus]|uniref:Transcription initiation factor IIB family protein n=1 Tax=Halopenitus salinus TaxID=1198295 RepID=A0ABD5URV0_9EURY